MISGISALSRSVVAAGGGGGPRAAQANALTAAGEVRHAGAAAELTLSATAQEDAAAADEGTPDANDSPELKKAFTDFVGQTFYGVMLASLRKMTDKPAYFHGGRGEEIFRGQLDQILAEKMSDTSRETFAGPMYELFIAGKP